MTGTPQHHSAMIGILGGMGPAATIDLMQRVIRATPGEDDADHIHLLVDHNPQVPSRIAALIEGTGESPAPTLQAMTTRLVAMGATALAMPCNTAHAYLDVIRNAAGAVPVLDMVDLSAERLAALSPARIGLLASTAVQITGLYDTALAHHGLEVRFPDNQAMVMAAIRAVKAAAVGPAERSALIEAATDLQIQGVDALLIACTELSVIQDVMPDGIPVLDALDVLAEAIVTFATAGSDKAV